MARPLSDAERRRQALAEFRGYREPRPLMERVHAVGALVSKVMLSLGLGERVREAEVIQAWKDVVGEYNALHSKPHRLKEGVLYVQVLQPSIRFELERVRGEVVSKLKERFGARAVREVRFRLG